MNTMKKLIKNILLGMFVGCSLNVTTSCTDLTETLYSDLNDTNIDLTNPDDIQLLEGQAIAQYRYLHTSWFGLFHQLEICTDQYMVPLRIGIGWGDVYINGHKHNWDYNFGLSENNWGYAYNCINYCNMVLDNLPEDNVEDRAQMRFFRAMTYYHLLDLFRNVPLQTTMNNPDGYVPEQVSGEEIYNFCVSELNDIKDVITTDYIHGWGNKYAVCMALAKLYLNKNVYLGTNDNQGYEDALAEVETVLTEGGFELAPNYKDNFRENLEGNPEIIFCVPGDRTHAVNFNLMTYVMPQAGMDAYASTATATNGSCAIPQFIDTYSANDKRLADTWAMDLQHYAVENADGTYTPNAGDPIPFTADDWSGTGYLNYNKNVHSIDGAYQQEGYRLHKYEIVGGGNWGTTSDDLVIFRLADAMFIKAECLLRLGRDEQTAADLVTEVRKRSFESLAEATRTVADLKGGSVYAYGHSEYEPIAYNDWSNYISTYEGGDDIELGGLFDDLGWEFACEEHRRQDMIRFKMADGRNVFNGKSYFCKDAVTTDHWNIFPIPESVMRTNTTIEQNPGYTGAK